jgi:SET domain-containing protein
LINYKESIKRETRYLKRGEIWCFTVNSRWVRDANTGGNVARFINHACRPNCYSHIVGRTIWIRAARNIKAGEELTYDYHTDGEKVIPCRCRPGCKTKL